MKILPHEIPDYISPGEPRKQRARVEKKPLPKIGVGNTRIDWAHFAELVKGKTYAQAAEIVGCSVSGIQNAVYRGWIEAVPIEPKRIPWEDYKEMSKDYTTYQLAEKLGIHVRSIQRAQSAGLLDCKQGQPNRWTKRQID